MPKFKLKNIVSRVVLGESWRDRESPDYLCAGFGYNILDSHSHEYFGSGLEDDVNTINSFSTTATADNLPGAGRAIDTYIYQPVGRRIERLAKRFTTLSSQNRTGSEDIGDAAIYSTSTTAYSSDSDDSANSVNSFSTTATANNLPGAGRAVDTYIFQPMGRRIERLAMRYTIASLHPARIAQYMGTDSTFDLHYYSYMSLNDVIKDLCTSRPNGSTIVAGMKGLIKQTQCVPPASPRKELR